MWIDRMAAILSKTDKALMAYDILYWSVIAVFGLSVLLMLLDTRIGPLLFVLVNVLSCVAVMAITIYIKQKSGIALALAPPAIASVSLAAGSLILWIILGAASRSRAKKRRMRPRTLDEEVREC